MPVFPEPVVTQRSARKIFAASLAVLFLLGINPSASSAAAEPVEINAILSMTGSAAFLGTRVSQTLSVAEKLINAEGGIAGRQLKFVIADDGSSPATAVQLATALIAKKAPVIIGPVVVATCAAVLPVVDKAGPQTYCLATPVQAPSGSFMATQGADAAGYIPKTLQYFRSRGIHRVALITSTDASGQSYERDFNEAMSGADWQGFELVAREHFGNTDISMAAQVARVKAAAPQAILSFSVGPSFGTLMRNLSDSGLNVPLVSSAANLNSGQLEPLRKVAPQDVLFVANSGAIPQPNAKGAWRAALTRYERAFADAGVRPEFLNTIAWDAIMLTLASYQKYGVDATSQQMRDRLLGTRGWTGIYGNYDFNAYPQRGLGQKSLVMYRWDAAANTIQVL